MDVPAVDFSIVFDKVVSFIVAVSECFGKQSLGQCFQGKLRCKVQNATDLGLLGSEKGLGIAFCYLD